MNNASTLSPTPAPRPAQTPSPTSKSNAFITIAVAFIISVIEGADIQAAGIAGTSMSQHFGLSKAEMGMFFSAGVFGLLPGSMLGGYLADRMGRKKVLLLSVSVFAIFTLATLLMDSLIGLSVVRFIAGVGMGMALPNLVALAAESVTAAKRSLTVGFMYAGMPLGAGLLSIYAMVMGGGDWKNIFMIGGLLPLLIIPVIIFALNESQDFIESKRKIAQTQQSENSFALLKSQGHMGKVILIGISFFFTSMVIYTMISWLPSLFKELGFSRVQGSTAQALFMLSAFVGAILMTYLMEVWNKRNVAIMMYIGMVSGLFSLNAAQGITQMYLAAILTGLFLIGSQGVIYALSGTQFPTEVRATAVGTIASIGRVGAILGPLAAGFILGSGYGAAGVVGSCIPAVLLAAVALIAVIRERKAAVASVSPAQV